MDVGTFREPPGYEPPHSAEELLERYAAGERYFARAKLANAKLQGAYLASADIHDADLAGADLRHATLSEAKLTGTDFSGADISTAELSEADLSGANFTGAKLSGANLFRTKLSVAIFYNADLSNVNLFEAAPLSADFTGANLSFADLTGTNMTEAICHGARLNGARLFRTHLVNVDLVPFCEAHPPVVHHGSSYIDEKSIKNSVRSPHLKNFLVRAGTSLDLAEYLIGRTGASSMHSVFISYGAPDATFAETLCRALEDHGVKTFLFSEHAEPGERLHRMMRKGVNEHDRVVLVCSKASLDRKGVMNELEETLARESRDGGETYLIPIRLDDYVLTGWKPKREDLAQAVRDRVVADFGGADADKVKFKEGVDKLLRALRKKTGV
jgi:hypothetical protein